MSLDDRIAELYGLPLDQFVAARTALAKSVSGADAKRVRSLAKPTVVPWAVNQVYWHARLLYKALLAKGAALRQAQIAALEGKKNDAAAAQQAHRQTLASAVTRATELARTAQASPGADDISRMFEAISLADTLAEPHGQFTRVIAPAGFEALAGISVKVPPRPAAASAVAPPASAGKPNGSSASAGERKPSAADMARERAEAQRAAAAERLREAALAKAERALERAQQAEAEARAAWQQAKQALDAAEQALRALE